MCLLLTLFWVEAVPLASLPDYAGVRLPLHMLAVYLLGAHYVCYDDDSEDDDNVNQRKEAAGTASTSTHDYDYGAYLRIAGRWLIALLVLAVFVDILYGSLVLLPVFITEQAGSSVMGAPRLFGTLLLTRVTFIISLVLVYLLARLQHVLADKPRHGSPHPHAATVVITPMVRTANQNGYKSDARYSPFLHRLSPRNVRSIV